MIKTQNWYLESKNNFDIVQEAGINDYWKNIVLSVSLILSGLPLSEVSGKTGLSENQIQEAMSNEEIVEQAKSQIPKINFSEIEKLIRKHEVSGAEEFVTVNGKKIDIRTVYPDPNHGWKVPTIGVGYNLNKPEAKQEIEALGLNYEDVRNGKQSLTNHQVNELYRNDIAKSIYFARKFVSNFDTLPTQAKTIISDMSFNLGPTRLNKFKNLRKALERRDFQEAAKEMQNSRWYNQVGNRSKTLVEMMKNIKEN